ncbi:chorismate lyase [Massilia sp. Dwa41.01b]|uniref:chorismate--pyruvate lyase family protein n=1 Tax=Massilia sp. Dwa41.01b TaxID=2709302 RepID=UPI0028044C5C|nr:chorismate lyase [Massilia sp. Dwa41.01b]
MRGASLRLAKWHRHADAVGAAIATRDWLTTRGSLTARLVASSKAFRVRRLHQKTVLCSLEEARAIGLPRRERVWEREVLLCCDGQPVVFGHTVVPMSATASDWPLFSALGERSLGTTLFYDPLVTRGPLGMPGCGRATPCWRACVRRWARPPMPRPSVHWTEGFSTRGAVSTAAVRAC